MLPIFFTLLLTWLVLTYANYTLLTCLVVILGFLSVSITYGTLYFIGISTRFFDDKIFQKIVTNVFRDDCVRAKVVELSVLTGLEIGVLLFSTSVALQVLFGFGMIIISKSLMKYMDKVFNDDFKTAIKYLKDLNK